MGSWFANTRSAVLAATARACASRLPSLPVVLQGQPVAAAPDFSANVFVSPMLRLVQICLQSLQTEVQPLLKLSFPGHVQMCLDRVHMKPVCMHVYHIRGGNSASQAMYRCAWTGFI